MTVEQLALDQQPTVTVGRGTPQQRWETFVAANPHVKGEVARTAAQLIDGGHRATISVVWEELRSRIRTSGDEYRLNNDYRAPAAAWLRAEHPVLARDMRTRR